MKRIENRNLKQVFGKFNKDSIEIFKFSELLRPGRGNLQTPSMNSVQEYLCPYVNV